MESISFLIGSGFSVPAGYPCTTEINNRLKRIDASEVYIHSSGAAWFLKEVNDSLSVVERDFVQEFIQFYNNHILKIGEEFHYESFYDYYQEYLINDNYPSNLSRFFQDFIRNHNHTSDEYDLLFQFDQCFNQLIKGLLVTPFEPRCLTRPYDASCEKFLDLVEVLSQNYIVNVHSLNHDLYLECLANSESIRAKMDDGFDELDSPYYGKLHFQDKTLKVQLPKFTDRFLQSIRLYKLHGSIDRYWVQLNEDMHLIKLKAGIDRTKVFKQIIEDGRGKEEFILPSSFADFLSGTTYKTKQYSRGEYYPIIFEHFKKNLESSKCLIIIGYGFRDEAINDYIRKSFLTALNKIMFIVDVNRPSTEFLIHQNVFYVSGGVVAMDNKVILNNMAI